jgi:hypothetical protein
MNGMPGHRLVQQDLASHLVASHKIHAGNHTRDEKIIIERLELHLGQPSGVRLTPGGVHALSTVRRRRPIYLLPPRPPVIINRSAELETLRQSVVSRHVVDLHGLDGAGKSTLAAALTHDLDLTQFPDGVVFVTGRLRYQDMLQALFDSFYESEIPVKITPEQTYTYLGNLRVLIILDDVGLGPQQVDPILDAMREAATLVVGPERSAVGRGRALHLHGLPHQEAVALFERAFKRSPPSDEAPTVDEICSLLNDMPLPITCVAAQAAQSKQSLTKLLADLQGRKTWAGPGADLSIGPSLEQIVLFLDVPARQLLTLVAAFAGPSASSEALRSLMNVPEAEFQQHAQLLQQLGLLGGVGSNQWVVTPSAQVQTTPRLALASAYHQTARTWLVDDAARLDIVNYYATRLSRGDHLPGDELPGLLGAIEDCARKGWLDQLKPLTRAADRSLAELCWWAEWQHVLDLTRRTAQAEGDRALEIWAMHQLGSVLGTLGHLERAIQLLRTALNMREAQGDQVGAALTAHNLETLELLMPQPVVVPTRERVGRAASQEAVGEAMPATPDQEALSLPAPDTARARGLRLRIALLTALAIVLSGALVLRFVFGVGTKGETVPGLTVTWEFGDAWNALDNETWTQQITISVEGDEGNNYGYFVDGEPAAQTFEVVRPLCDGAEGTIRVESEAGKSGEVPYAFDSPYCR